jgi:hypothetical protein
VTEKELEYAPERVKLLIKLGYSTIDIRSPREFMRYEN